MKIQTPPGMRDFYPPDMRVQTWLLDAWRDTARAFGFEEYEGPIFEYLELYTLKSGQGIVSELFHFEDRGGRRFAIRPEMTPTLARMVAAKANTLPRPIKWFSLPRMCRAEKPQRGRLREFFQWNVDVLGVDDVLADAEVIAVALAFARQVGLTPDDVVMRVSSRPLAAGALTALGIAPEQCLKAFELIDRFDKLGPDEFARQWSEFAPDVPCDRLLDQLERTDLEHALELVTEAGHEGRAAAEQFSRLWDLLKAFGVSEFCQFDLKVVRGLAYYTGPVFELSARQGGLRALLGGGRYDDLTSLLEGPKVPAVGFGMGDAPVLELLKSLNKLPEPAQKLDIFVIDAGSEYFVKALEIVSGLRRAGLACDFSYKRQSVGKQFRQAASRGAEHAVVVGEELVKRGQLTVKDLRAGTQKAVSVATFLKAPREILSTM